MADARWLLPLSVLVMLGAPACRHNAPVARDTEDTPAEAPPEDVRRKCAISESFQVVTSSGESSLSVWEGGWNPIWASEMLPEDVAYLDFRARIEAMGANDRTPEAQTPELPTEERRLNWQRELDNVALAYSGQGGTLRPISCLEALLFARQQARHDQLEHPTEFIAAVLVRQAEKGDSQAKIYFASGPDLFPPKAVYPFPFVEEDLKEGWEFVHFLHNHTVQQVREPYALGVTAPSTQDVALSRGLAESLGLQHVVVTNGFFTLDLPATLLEQYQGPPEAPASE